MAKNKSDKKAKKAKFNPTPTGVQSILDNPSENTIGKKKKNTY